MSRISGEEDRNDDDDELVAVAEWVVTGVSGHPSNFRLLVEAEGRRCCHILFLLMYICLQVRS